MSTPETLANFQMNAARSLLRDGPGDLIQCGRYKAQARGDRPTIYGAFPDPFDVVHGLEQGSPLAISYYPPANSVVLTPVEDLPDGLDEDDVLPVR